MKSWYKFSHPDVPFTWSSVSTNSLVFWQPLSCCTFSLFCKIVSRSTTPAIFFCDPDIVLRLIVLAVFFGDFAGDSGFLLRIAGEIDTLLLATVFLLANDWVSWLSLLFTWLTLGCDWLLFIWLGCCAGSGGKLNLVNPVPRRRKGFGSALCLLVSSGETSLSSSFPSY